MGGQVTPRLVVFLPVLLVVALLVIGQVLSTAQTTAPLAPACGNEVRQEKIRAIMSEAVEQALKEHIVNLHAVWMRDERGQPHRASLGVEQGISAYIRGRDAVEAWKLQPC